MPRPQTCDKCEQTSINVRDERGRLVGPKELEHRGWRRIVVGMDAVWTCPQCWLDEARRLQEEIPST